MDDQHWLREALRGATARQPVAGDRVGAAFAVVRRRRQQRVVAASCMAVVAVFVATVVNGAGSTQSGLKPVAPSTSPTATAEPSADPTASPATDPAATAGPESPGATGAPSAGPVTGGPGEPTGSPDPAGPAVPTVAAHDEPVDVYVLLDATGDMVGFGDMLKQGLRSVYDRLRTDRVDLRWGLGTFTDYIVGNPSMAYERVRDLGPTWATMDQIRYAGGGDSQEADTLGLDGAIGVGHLPYTPSDQGASFRAKARKFVVLVTDAPFKRGEGYPTIAESVARLVSHGVTVVAVQPTHEHDTDSLAKYAHSDLLAVAKGTHGIAAAAVDCDGDGRDDVAKGRPIVCELAMVDHLAGLADAIVALVRR
jgi:hypothetical protein